MNFDIFKALNHAQSIIGEDVSIEVCSKPYGGRGSVEVRIIDRASVPSRAATFVIQKHELESDAATMAFNIKFHRALISIEELSEC